VKNTHNIFLVGLMGAGKTTVARILARRLDRAFYDTDHEIERRTGVKIPVIFEIEGEEGFRLREAQALDELSALDNVILATGGGVVVRPENRELLKSRGVVVYLRAQPRDLWYRTRHDKNRPLLQTPDPLGRLQELYTQRDPLYAEVADIVIDTGRPNVGPLVTQLLEKLESVCKQSA
jgi:shikimate kinase